jgi:hypothetical protein
MKQFSFAGKAIVTAFAFGAMLLQSCKKDSNDNNNVSAYGSIEMRVSNNVDGQPITLGAMNYTNAAGNLYRVDLLKYYMTNVTLVKADGTEKNYKNYNLVDESDAASKSFTIDSIDNGEYTAVKFSLGVDPDRNHTGAQDGALDPIHGMIWSWNTGYIFFKHEGMFKDNTGTDKSLLYHYGTDKALAAVTMPVTKFEVKGNKRIVYVKFNLNQLYANPTTVDFNVDNLHQSTASSDVTWINVLRGNFPNAFSVDKVE